MELLNQVDKLFCVISDIKHGFSEDKVDEAIGMVKEIQTYVDYKCGGSLSWDLETVKKEGKVSDYKKQSIDKNVQKLIHFSKLYNMFDNEHSHLYNVDLTAMIMLCRELGNKVEGVEDLEGFNEVFDEFITELDSLKEDIEFSED